MRQRPPPPSDNARQALAKYRETVSEDKRRDIEQAIKHLRKINAPINISTVAARAGVQRKTVYKHDDLVAVIDAYRHHPSTPDNASTTRETSILAALRAQLAAKDTEIRTLRTKLAEQESTIALLYGQLDSYTT
ncbi:transposase [Mycobacterium sp. SMC-4]|uniref:transposase n=1 Tax=Mycobacterium sp. SMC-4 TaxID=2857059 RepID=UPI0021B478BC|nr:transposase [Mycobacterium sp. SMC-4]UXA21103.1 transposase [Mycobacterium sp. SMC-4]